MFSMKISSSEMILITTHKSSTKISRSLLVPDSTLRPHPPQEVLDFMNKLQASF